jgi:hypothetical protein
VPRKSVVVAAALVLSVATMITQAMAFGHGTWGGGAHFARGGFAGHRFAVSHSGFAHPFRRGFVFRRGFAFRKAFAIGGFWPYYGYVPTDAFGDIDAMTYTVPETVGFLPEPPPAPVCHRSEEIVTVPSENGGTRQIKIIRCP